MFSKLICVLLAFVQLIQAVTGVNVTDNNNIETTGAMAGDAPVPYLENIGCGAYEYITGTDTNNHQYLPYYVKLFRCQGADTSHVPTHRSCQPVESHIKKVNIGVVEHGVYKVITLLNHTKCEYRCKESPSSCTKYQKWNDDACRCDCDVNTRAMCKEPMVWGQSTCCACSIYDIDKCSQDINKVIDNETCLCVAKTHESKGDCKGKTLDVNSMVTIASLELIIVVAICFLSFYCCCYRHDNMTLSVVNKMDFNKQCLFSIKKRDNVTTQSSVDLIHDKV